MAQKKITLVMSKPEAAHALHALQSQENRDAAGYGPRNDALHRVIVRLSDSLADPVTLDAPERQDEGADEAQDDDGTES